MKYFIAIALLVAVASAGLIKPDPVVVVDKPSGDFVDITPVLDSEAPSGDFVDITPVLDSEAPSGDFVDIFPVLDSVAPSEDFVDIMPVLDSVAPAAASSSPLVQIIVNVNQAAAAPGPVVVPSPVDVDAPLDIVDNFPVFDSVSPVQVVDTAPVAVEPVNIGTPVIPAPAVNLPEILN
ncbi:uncharacterized protein LOC142980080 [Anticarsia gemmatalis]|uniref:uncharacterized protein LOC142980080 n=1 Tax=Anticarsia gemmatalis TaxID=129554 RepID=UPI003F76AC73